MYHASEIALVIEPWCGWTTYEALGPPEGEVLDHRLRPVMRDQPIVVARVEHHWQAACCELAQQVHRRWACVEASLESDGKRTMQLTRISVVVECATKRITERNVKICIVI